LASRKILKEKITGYRKRLEAFDEKSSAHHEGNSLKLQKEISTIYTEFYEQKSIDDSCAQVCREKINDVKHGKMTHKEFFEFHKKYSINELAEF